MYLYSMFSYRVMVFFLFFKMAMAAILGLEVKMVKMVQEIFLPLHWSCQNVFFLFFQNGDAGHFGFRDGPKSKKKHSIEFVMSKIVEFDILLIFIAW